MKIYKILNNIKNVQIKKLINKYTYIDENMPQYYELSKIRYPLAKYAKDNNVFVSIKDPAVQDAIYLSVQNKKTKNGISVLVETDPQKIYTTEKSRLGNIKYNKVGLLKEKYEDNWLRHLYRTIEKYTKEVEKA